MFEETKAKGIWPEKERSEPRARNPGSKKKMRKLVKLTDWIGDKQAGKTNQFVSDLGKPGNKERQKRGFLTNCYGKDEQFEIRPTTMCDIFFL